MLTHEELQASIEEFETTNEELQATNEELETNNEELQATNEELETTNDELRARTSELQELTVILESERRRLSEMVELAPFYILVLHGPTLIVEAYNPRYARLLDGRAVQGRPLDEVLDLFWESGVEIVHLARDAYRLDTILTTPRMLTYLPKTQDAHGEHAEYYFTYTIVPSHDANGKVDGVVIYTLDETEKRLQEAEEERERLKLIFQNFSTAALALFDAQSRELIMGSPRYLEIVAQFRQLSPETLIGRRWEELTFITSSVEQAIQFWTQVIESRNPLRIPEMSYRSNPDEKESIWNYTLAPLMDSEHPDRVRFMLVSAIEVTEQVQSRKELEKLDSLKDDFLSLITHELRNPLTTIHGNTQLLQRELRRQSTDPERERHLDMEQTALNRIIHQVDRMNRLIEEVLDVTRIRGKVFEVHNHDNVNIVELVRDVVEQLTPQDRQIVLRTEEQTLPVTIDANRIEQVLHNLISNALKYSPSTAPVTVMISTRTNPIAEVVISIHDEGPGISEEEQAHIFKRFYRGTHHSTKEDGEGLGLGLYIASEIVRQQGGSMWLDSASGRGSTFSFSLPLRPSQ